MTMLKIATVEKESLYLNQLLKKNFSVFKNLILVLCQTWLFYNSKIRNSIDFAREMQLADVKFIYFFNFLKFSFFVSFD